MFKNQIKPAIFMFLIFTIITGIIYPLAITGIAQLIFPEKANGSIIYIVGAGSKPTHTTKPIGSKFIGQSFDDPKYFWGRPSATTPVYNAASSSGSNLGPLNPQLINNLKARIEALKVSDPDNKNLIPVDLVTSSASGLDPHISVAGAMYQASRVARLRGLNEETLKSIVERHTSGRFLGLIGEPVVNVLELNLELDNNIIK
ncbi:potassium-transporting ATPase subunit KdpC [Candidatus Poribacteria bacterium]|nr:potassium-transporting ATPase subunit KdpC [Candidatus Poribacteria bacterium]